MKRILLISAITVLLTSCGKDGAQGPQGAPGNPGAPGSSVTTVLPCPAKIGTNPQILLCIENSLYSVYVESDPHNTRYVLLTVGNYQTDDGRSCNFTVTAGCVLSNEH